MNPNYLREMKFNKGIGENFLTKRSLLPTRRDMSVPPNKKRYNKPLDVRSYRVKRKLND